MKQVFFYSDSPIATTGLGRVTRYIVPSLAEKFKIIQVALNHHFVKVNNEGVHADYDRDLYKWDIISTYLNKDSWGVDICKKILSQYKFDIIFTSCDINRVMPFYAEIKRQQENGAKWVLYTPIDRNQVLKGEEEVFALADELVVLSKFAKKKLEEKKVNKDVKVIYHPLDFSEFPILSQEEKKDFREKYYKHFSSKDFIIGNINRNQFRKDLVRSLAVLKEYQKYDKKARLYLHTKAVDEGGDLNQNIVELDIFKSDVMFADIQDASQALDQLELAKIYNSLDAMISTSKGEGFGFSTVEAMACKVPIVVPNNTSFTEFVGENEERGYLADCKEWVVDYGYSNCQRYLTDINSMVNKLNKIKTNPEEAKDKVEKAYAWVKKELDLKTIQNKFLDLMENV